MTSTSATPPIQSPTLCARLGAVMPTATATTPATRAPTSPERDDCHTHSDQPRPRDRPQHERENPQAQRRLTKPRGS